MSIDEKTRLLLNKHLEEYQQLSKRLNEQLVSVLEASQQQAREFLQLIVEVRRAFENVMADTAAQRSQIAESIRNLDLSRYAKQAAEMKKAIERAISPVFEQIRQSFIELPPKMQESILLLAKHGWYLDMEMPMPGILALLEALDEGNQSEIEEALCDYFQDRLARIEESIVKRFPHRTHLVRAAFDAHRREEYVLSIPVLLAQTDGICKEVTDQHLFTKEKGKPHTAKYVERWAANKFRKALLGPLAQTTPINASERERPGGSDALNRHTVLHGEDVNYGSKKNSLKAISLLDYIVHVLSDAKQQKP
jgi:hypothetical protein